MKQVSSGGITADTDTATGPVTIQQNRGSTPVFMQQYRGCMPVSMQQDRSSFPVTMQQDRGSMPVFMQRSVYMKQVSSGGITADTDTASGPVTMQQDKGSMPVFRQQDSLAATLLSKPEAGKQLACHTAGTTSRLLSHSVEQQNEAQAGYNEKATGSKSPLPDHLAVLESGTEAQRPGSCSEYPLPAATRSRSMKPEPPQPGTVLITNSEVDRLSASTHS